MKRHFSIYCIYVNLHAQKNEQVFSYFAENLQKDLLVLHKRVKMCFKKKVYFYKIKEQHVCKFAELQYLFIDSLQSDFSIYNDICLFTTTFLKKFYIFFYLALKTFLHCSIVKHINLDVIHATLLYMAFRSASTRNLQ